MNSNESTPTGVSEPLLPSLDYVKKELRRIPTAAKIRLNQLGVRDDLAQELHLAYYENIRKRSTAAVLKRAIHAAGERLRYREVVRRAKYEVPEDFAGREYHLLMYGEEPGAASTNN
ncbi:MAG: hypothetical protein QOH70_1322 [Blastocatellia bacterium]|jgi:hypothetical protein|nr:hypothetical protein [Blastocatellia bacterium]